LLNKIIPRVINGKNKYKEALGDEKYT